MKPKKTSARARFLAWLEPKRSALRSWAAGNRHVSLSLADMRRRGWHPKRKIAL